MSKLITSKAKKIADLMVTAMKTQSIQSMCLGILLASAPLSVLADDTDIYNNLDALEALDVRPNVLLILDTSKSMDCEVGASVGCLPASPSRMDEMREVLEEVFNNENLHGRINVGLARFNSTGGSINYPIVELNEANAQILIGRLDDHMTPAGSTPIVPAYFEGVRYMLGMDVDGGLSRPYVGGSSTYYGHEENLRISNALSLEGGSWDPNDDNDCDGMDSDDSDCIEEEWDDGPTYISPITEQCQPNHIVVLTDGEANSNEVEGDIEDFIGGSCSDNRDNLECSMDLAEYLYTTDLFDDSDAFEVSGEEIDQKIITHTIAFDVDYEEFRDIATAGGGSYFPADDAEKLADAFIALFDSFMDINTTFAAPSATVNQFNRLNHLDDIYFAVFRPEGNAVWPGNIKKYKLATGTITSEDAQGNDEELQVGNNTIVDKYNRPAIDSDSGFFLGSSIDFWSSRTPAGVQAIIDADEEVGFSVTEGGAANQILATPSDGARKVYAWVNGALEDDVAADDSTLTKAVLGIAGAPDNELKKLRHWIAGIDVSSWDTDDPDTLNADAYRQEMGDPLHSRPVVVTYGLDGNGDPDLAMFFGTNDGYFRAIDANTGAEHFSFIPEEMLGDMQTRMDNAAGAHLYGVDGAPTVWVKDDNGNGIIETTNGNEDRVYVYFGFRRGGSSYYALNVTDLDSPTVMWTIDNTGDFAEMGQTWSKPIKTKIVYDLNPDSVIYDEGEKDVLIFAGGYDTNQDDVSTDIHRRADTKGRAVYVVDANTGNLLWKTDVTDNAAMAYSIPANMSVIDPDLSGHADQMYVGDMGGQVWRFDINSGGDWDGTGALPSNFITAQVVATLAADNSDDHARRFYQSPDIALIKEDDEVKIALVIGSGYRARPNETGVQDRFYMIKLPNPYEPLGSFTALTHDDLVDVTDNIDPTFQDTDFGWWIDMENTGEKVLSTPLIVDGKVIWVTYEPTARLVGCTVQPGTSREYVVNLLDGSPAFKQPGGDIDDPTTKDDRSRDLEGGTIIDEPVIIFTEDGGGSTFLGTEKGTPDITNNRATRTFWYERE